LVLTRPGDAGSAGVPGPPSIGRLRRGTLGQGADDGSQTLEFALSLPLVILWLCLLVHAALLCSDLVVAQTLAREAARVAAVSDDADVRATLDRVAGRRPVRLELRPPTAGRRPDDLVTARLEVRSAAFAAFGTSVWIPAQATMRVEDR
jgi:uncharacterized protein YceH (UPF0502 family)